MEIKPVIKVEPTKPSEKKGFLVAFMLGWEWESVFSKLGNLFKKKPKGNETRNVGGEN